MKDIKSFSDTVSNLSSALDVKNVVGDPVNKEGTVRVPVSKVSVAGFHTFLPMNVPSRLNKPHTRVNSRLMGHILIDESGVRWRPRINIVKLVMACAAFVAYTVWTLRRSQEERSASVGESSFFRYLAGMMFRRENSADGDTVSHESGF